MTKLTDIFHVIPNLGIEPQLPIMVTPEQMAAINEYIAEIIGKDDRDYSQDNADPESLKILVATSTACNELRADQRKRAGITGSGKV